MRLKEDYKVSEETLEALEILNRAILQIDDISESIKKDIKEIEDLILNAGNDVTILSMVIKLRNKIESEMITKREDPTILKRLVNILKNSLPQLVF